jgi:hypothetical protein
LSFYTKTDGFTGRKKCPNSTYWEVNLFSDDLEFMEREKTPVLAIAVSSGSGENNGNLT